MRIDLLRGRIDVFSADALIDMLARLGVGVRLVGRYEIIASGHELGRRVARWKAAR